MSSLKTGEQPLAITVQDVMQNPKAQIYIQKADQTLEAMGYTEHGMRHARWVSKTAGRILRELGYPERTAQLAEIAAFLHDIGNVVSRTNHAQIGAILAQNLLYEMGMPPEEVAEIMTAIGNHHEEDGLPVTPVAAALILADKADVHRTRVRSAGTIREDIHDRVNYSAKRSHVRIDPVERVVTYELEIDTQIAPVFEYFEIFLERMLVASKAAKALGCKFSLTINGVKML